MSQKKEKDKYNQWKKTCQWDRFEGPDKYPRCSAFCLPADDTKLHSYFVGDSSHTSEEKSYRLRWFIMIGLNSESELHSVNPSEERKAGHNEVKNPGRRETQVVVASDKLITAW